MQNKHLKMVRIGFTGMVSVFERASAPYLRGLLVAFTSAGQKKSLDQLPLYVSRPEEKLKVTMSLQ